jgi:hypothetical protein
MARKEQKKKSGQTESKSRANYTCPENLANLIFWANYILPDQPLPDVGIASDIKAIVSKKYRSVGWLNQDISQSEINRMIVWELVEISDVGKCYGELFVQLFKGAIERSGKKLPKTLNGALFLPGIVDDFLWSYSNHRDAIISFIKIAKIVNEIRKGNQDKYSLSQIRILEPPLFFIDENNKIDADVSNTLVNALRGVDADRLRTCEICNRIFWAKREDSETCSPKCFGVLRTRRYRTLTEEQKAERKAQREANKAYKLKLKNNKEQNNGTL